MVNKLVIPSCKGLLDAFHTTVNYADSIAFLVAPQIGGQDLQVTELLKLAKRHKTAGAVEHSVFNLGVYSYLFAIGALYQDEPVELKLSKLREFLGLSRGGNGFPIVDRLLQMNEIFAVWYNSQLCKLADVSLTAKNTILFRSTYFQKVAKYMLESTRNEVSEGRSPFYTDLVHSSIVNERNHAAVEIVIELVKLLERRGNCYGHPAHIGIDKLIYRCPALVRKLVSAGSISKKNAILRTDVAKALELLVSKTDCYQKYAKLNVIIPERFNLNVKNGNALIEIPHKGNLYNLKRRAAADGKSRGR